MVPYLPDRLGTMKKQSGVAAVTLRKGVVGDWKNHMGGSDRVPKFHESKWKFHGHYYCFSIIK